MLTCDRLKKTFRDKTAVADISFTIADGELFALLGRNGAGKTTTIKMILGLLPKDNGDIHITEGVRIGYSPETPYFPGYLSGSQVLGYYGRIQGLKRSELSAEIKRVMQAVGLRPDKTKVKDYSKGMLQRLAMAQALLGDPEMLVLDEPTAGLDALGRLEFVESLRQMKASGKTIILNSHILSDVERVCDRAVIIDAGRIVYEWSQADSSGQTLEAVFLKSIGRTSHE
ncbi:MAG: ABC transporter ATP-binding protein [Coriobacteriales bacterium]|jgi:ABC-2 type transport system ATP-binding protein|nr:ABC transporter ATP-binding protein [Coriobacteriales bacterium]